MLRRVGMIYLTLLFVISGLIFAAAAYPPSAAALTRILDLGMLGPIASLLPSTPTSPSGLGISAPLGQPDESAARALPSPNPSGTPTITPTKTPFFADTPTQTPTLTAAPSETLTPTRTLTPSPTLTPSETALGTPLPASTFTATLPPTATGFPNCSPTGNSSFEIALLTLINGERESSGLPAYSQQSQLQAAAQIHSTDMACNGFFSHIGSDGSTKEERASAQGYAGTSVGENLFGIGDTSSDAPQLALDFWMASPPNQANILHEEYTDIGIGYIHESSSPFGGYFSVLLARP